MNRNLFALLAMLAAFLFAVGCNQPDDDSCVGAQCTDDDGSDDDDDNSVDPTPYAFAVAAPIPLESASVDGFVCDIDADGVAQCETNRVIGVPLKGEVTNYLFVDLETTITQDARLVIDGEEVCDLGEEEDCDVSAWTGDYQYGLAPNGTYMSDADGGPGDFETDEVAGEVHILFTFNGCEFPVTDNSFSGMCGKSNYDIGTISDDLEEIYYHKILWDGSEFEDTWHRQ